MRFGPANRRDREYFEWMTISEPRDLKTRSDELRRRRGKDRAVGWRDQSGPVYRRESG